MAKEISDYSKRVVNAVKAEMARRGVDGKDLVVPLGMGRNAIYARLRNERAFAIDEVEAIAGYLDIDPAVIFDAASAEYHAKVAA